MKQFWMVWRQGSSAPTFRHDSEDAATREAERLATINRGEQFFVLEAIGLRVVDDMLRVDLRNGGGDDLPF